MQIVIKTDHDGPDPSFSVATPQADDQVLLCVVMHYVLTIMSETGNVLCACVHTTGYKWKGHGSFTLKAEYGFS